MTPTSPPLWLTRLAARVPTMSVEQLSRFAPPPQGGRQSAVLVLFGPHPQGGEAVVLIERAHTMRSQPGQMAFPGGALEPDDADETAAALREAHEEIALDREGVAPLAALPAVYLPPANFVVTPVLAWWSLPSPVHAADPAEVAQVVYAPVRDLVDPTNRHTVVHPSGYAGPAFVVNDLVVWGFTAHLLDRILDLAGLTHEWDAQRRLPLPERFMAR